MGRIYVEVCYWLARWLFGLLVPLYWIQNTSYDEAWDLECRRLLDQGTKIKRGAGYTASFGNHTLWVTNHPYASFTKYNGIRAVSGMPSRLTRYRMMRRLIKSNFYQG